MTAALNDPGLMRVADAECDYNVERLVRGGRSGRLWTVTLVVELLSLPVRFERGEPSRDVGVTLCACLFRFGMPLLLIRPERSGGVARPGG